jgi:signal transduction histidine kinase
MPRSPHLPLDQPSPQAAPRTIAASDAFVEEALHWTPDSSTSARKRQVVSDGGPRPRVVLADDNADMREYVTKLLADHFEVATVPDGEAALEKIREWAPDLVLSDVMMPKLDGFELLSALRGDPRTRELPVILLSARAGAESSVEGMDAGADDYLVKPFTARELIARVRTHIALSWSRRAWVSQLERANQELGRANQELEAFSYSVSHDLRAPVRAIAGFSQVLLGGYADALDDDGRDCLQQIEAGARRMGSIIDDLLALSKAGRGELRKETVDLTAIAHQVMAGLRARFPSRVVDITVEEGLIATGDGRLVTIVLENLLANAWKFTGRKTDAAILVGREDSGAFFVRDNGAGFDMAHSAHMFEPFQRLHTEGEFEGTGIGLAIVRRIIERHGGRVWADGAVGDGATVRFTLEAGPS